MWQSPLGPLRFEGQQVAPAAILLKPHRRHMPSAAVGSVTGSTTENFDSYGFEPAAALFHEMFCVREAQIATVLGLTALLTQRHVPDGPVLGVNPANGKLRMTTGGKIGDIS